MRNSPHSIARSLAVCLLALAFARPLLPQAPQVKIGSLDLAIGGIQATVTPASPVIPKNIASGVQVVVTQNGKQLTPAQIAQFLGGTFQLVGEYSGPGLTQTIEVPQSPPPPNSLLVNLPAVTTGGNYTLSNLRFVVNNAPVFDVSPSAITVQVIDQVLVTSVQTTPLTVDQIQSMGVVLDSSSYIGFQFTIGLQFSSQVVNLSFPVVFNQQGVPIPTPLVPPPTLPIIGPNIPPPTIIPVLLSSPDGTPMPAVQLPDGGLGTVKIPSVIVIPGNVGYLKQFFSAQLYVANGAPAGSNLSVDNISGTINLPTPTDGVAADAPLSLPSLKSGAQPTTLNVLAPDPGGKPTVATLNPGDTGQAQWTIRGDKEGYYAINFNINATLEGLPTGPFNLTGTAIGGVLVRNPYFDMTFTVPGVVRKGELFNVYATVSNISQVAANNLTVNFDQSSLSGVTLVTPPAPVIPALNAGDSKTLTFQFQSLTTGKVVASYLHFDTSDGTTGNLNFTLGVFANGTPMSPDTLVLPSSVDNLPTDVVDAAMRVLGQAWSVATAPSLPAGVLPTSKTLVTQKALALAEAGLRQSLGEPLPNALRDLGTDFFGGSPVDPGFDQVLRTTPAGQNFVSVLGTNLAQPMTQAGGAAAYELQLAQVEASGPNFVTLAVGSGTGAAPVSVTLTDGAGNQISSATAGGSILGGVLFPLGTSASVPYLGLLTSPINSPYTLLLSGTSSGSVDISISVPRGDGTVVRGTASGVSVVQGQQMRVVADLTNPNNLVLQIDTAGNGTFATSVPLGTQMISPSGPSLISTTVIGPETVSQAGPFGLSAVILFDRPVDATTSRIASNYTIPNNSVTSASEQLSGRLVFANLAQPEGPYVPTTFSVNGVADQRGVAGPAGTVTLQSRLQDPGAVVTGRVLGPDGAPATAAKVTYENSPYFPNCQGSGSGLVGLAVVPVESTGGYQFRYVHQDQCGGPFAMATKDPTSGALRQVTTSVRAPGQQMVIDLALLGQGSVAGKVTDLSGKPVYNAQVVAVSGTDPQVGSATYTDANGNYVISGITVGPVTVKAIQGISLGNSAGNIERAGTTAVVNVTLNGGAVNVSGTVTQLLGGTAVPAPGVPVVYYIVPNSITAFAVGVGITAGDGTYSITGMPTGPYRITANPYSQFTASQTGVAAAGVNVSASLEIVIPTTGTVNGKVSFPNGTPAAGAIVSLQSNAALTNPDGTFSLSGVPILPSQSQQVSAHTADYLRSGSASVVISSNTPVNGANITLSGLGSAQFTVLDPSGNPVPGQTVVIPNGTSNCGGLSQATNASGVAVFTGLPVGAIKAVALSTRGNFQDLASGTATITQDGGTGYATMHFNGAGTVTGNVVDTSNKPVLGATVQVSYTTVDPTDCALLPIGSQSLQTDSSGNFQFTQVNVGKVAVQASQAFYPTPVGGQGVLSKNGATINFPLQLVNTTSGVLSGTIFLPDGVTAAGAGVQVVVNGPLPNVTVNTDANGNYKFAKILPAGQYTLTASDPVSGGVNLMKISLPVGLDMTQNLRLLGTGTVNVTVVDGAGAPVSSAFATLTETGFPNASFSGSLDASNQGVLPFPNVFEGQFSVQVQDQFGRGGRVSGTLPQGAASVNAQVQLTTTGTVQGHFFMPDGVTPISNGSVLLTANGVAIGQFTSLSTGDVGSYSFQYVPAGPVELKAQDPLTGRTGIAAGAIAMQGQILTLDVKAQGLNTIQGLVTSNGAPEPGASVIVVSGNFQATTVADNSGMYLMSGVPEGVIVATASLGNYFLSGTASSAISGDGKTLTLNVALRSSGTVAGQLFQADGVTPAPPSTITINVGGFGGGSETTTSDAQGKFSFQNVPAGSGTISANVLGGIDQAYAPISVAAGTTTTVQVTLNGIGGISGVALDSNGNPTAGSVALIGTGNFPYYLLLTAAADGTFSVPQVLAGPFTAKLSADIGGFTLYGTATGSVIPGQTAKFTVQVQSSGTITGLVLRPDGVTPAVGAAVSIRLPGTGSITLQAQNDGTFTAVGVPLGAFSVLINDPSTNGIAAVEGQSLTSNGQTVNLGTITLDANALSLITSNPADGTAGVGVNQALTLTFSEALAGTGGISVLNGTTTLTLNASLSSDGKTVSLQGQMPDGLPLVLNVTTQVTDVFGRQLLQAQQIHFTTVDLTPPYVTSISPANRSIQVPVSATVVATFNKALSTTANLANVITVSVGSVAVPGTTTLTPPSALTFTPSAPLAINTVYTVNVDGAVSFGGNVQTSPSTSVFVSPDTLPPTLQQISPANGAFVGSSRPTINIALTDNLSGINPATAALSIGNQPVMPIVGGNAATFTPAAPLADGSYSITASVQNNAGILGTISGSFNVDTTAPAVPQLTGITGGQTVTGVLTLTASSTDAGSGVAHIDVYVDGNFILSLQPPSFQGTYNTVALSAGTHVFTARAVDSVGNISVFNAATNVVVQQTGSVVGTVVNGQGQPINGAQISLTASNGTFTTATAANGTYQFNGLPLGAVSLVAVDPSTGFRTAAQGSISSSGQVLTINISVIATGTINGTVLRADNVTPAVGVQVTLYGPYGSPTTSTDSQGHYSFTFVPLGGFTISVTDTSTGDRGVASNQLTVNGQTSVINVVLNGFGKVTVNVLNAAGGAAPNVQVTVQGQTQFGGTQSGTTQTNGTITFTNVFAGAFNVYVVDPQTGLQGSANASVAPGATATVTVQLQPAGTITGKVFAADGVTALPNVPVSLSGQVSRQTTTSADGSFQFTVVPLGAYTLTSTDSSGNTRAYANVALANNGATVTQNLTWVALGTVSGQVTNPDSSPAAGVAVSLHSDNPLLGRYFSATTNAQGNYQFTLIPAGNISVQASVPAQGLLGDANGALTQDGQQVTLNITLVSNAITLPAYLYDGNGFFFDIQTDDSVGSGSDSVFYGNGTNTHGFLLNIVSAGNPTPFTGNSIGSGEISGRQVDVTQQSIAGLNVTRKVYVPQDGYFARYLEILNNPTSSPITVDVQLTTNLYAYYPPDSVIATSTGGTSLNVSNTQNPDRWVVIDDSNGSDPFLSANSPATGFAFDGPGASNPVSAATFSTPSTYTGQLSYQWSSVTVPANSSVAFMHFGLQQISRSAAEASVARLVQLPPEALVGLSPQEITEILNFAVPTTGTSPLAPLLTSGIVKGTVLAGDGATPVSNAAVTLKSNSPYYGRTYSAYSANDGSFQFQTTLSNYGPYTIIVPIDSFSLGARHQTTGAQSPATPGNFAAGQTTATQNVEFAGTGLISGTVRRDTGAPATNGGYVLAQPQPSGSTFYFPLAPDGTYLATGLAPGSYSLTGNISVPQGSNLTGTATATVTAGQVTSADIPIQATGFVQGVVTTATGVPAAGVNVFLQIQGSSTCCFSRSTYTDANGNYLLADVPVGSWLVVARESNTGVVTSVQVAVTKDQTTAQNLRLTGYGTLQVTVNFAGGNPATNAYVTVQQGGFSYFQFGGYTDSAGHLTIPYVAIGGFTVKAQHPANYQVFATATGAVVNNGDVIPVTVSLPGVGTIAGQVTTARGTVVGSAYVTITGANNTSYATNTDSNGNYSIGGVQSGTAVTVTAHSPADYAIFRSTNLTVGADGSTTTANLVMPAIASVQVTVLTNSGPPAPGVYVYIQDAFHNYLRFVGTTDTNGNILITNVPEGSFTVQAQDSSGHFEGNTTSTVAPANDGQTVNVTINEPPTANVQGTVYGGDGQTPIPYVSVQISDTATGQVLRSINADGNGFYQFSTVSAGSQGFTVSASYYSGGTTYTASATGTITSPGQTITVNLTIPISMITGTVSFSDGTPAPNAYVSVMQTNAAGQTTGYFSTQADINGNFKLFGVAVGAFSLQALDRNSGIFGSLNGNLTSLTSPVQLTVVLQTSGSLSGAIFDANGAVVPYAQIQLNTSGAQYDQYATADGQGNYSFAHVPAGVVVVTAGPSTYNGAVLGASSGSITTSGQALVLNVNLEPTSTLTGTVFASDGVTPVPSANLIVENPSLSAGLGDFYFDGFGNGINGYLTADASGNFVIPNIPVGTVKVTGMPSGFGNPSGTVTGTLQVGTPLALNPVFGNAFNFYGGNYDLSDANGFLSDIDCTGEIRSGGFTSGGNTFRSYNYAASSLLDSNYGFPFCNYGPEYAAVEQSGRQLTFGPRPTPGSYSNGVLQVARRIFVPQNGGFTRYLEELTNPLSTAVTVTVEMDSGVANYPDTLADDPATNGSTFAVVQNTTTSTAPVLGWVFSGASASTVPVTSFVAGQYFNSYAWTVTVQPGQTVILMHFLIQHPNGDLSGTESQAQSLVNLTDPNALVGMSTQEKAEVVNFNVP